MEMFSDWRNRKMEPKANGTVSGNAKRMVTEWSHELLGHPAPASWQCKKSPAYVRMCGTRLFPPDALL